MAVRQHKRKDLASKFLPVTKITEATARNQIWQIDTQQLDIWVKYRYHNQWFVIRPFLQAVIDVATRAFMGQLLLPSAATAWSTLTLLRQAILTKPQAGWPMAGLCQTLEADNGAENKNTWVQQACAALQITNLFDPPGYPNNKGKMERVFRTFNDGLMRGLPGHIKTIGVSETAACHHIADLLTFEQLARQLTSSTVDHYHHRLHASLQTAPFERWQQETTPLIIPTLPTLNLALVSGDRLRKVSNQGLRWQQTGRTTIFWAAELVPMIAQSVRVFYDPSQPAQIEVLHPTTGALLCLAERMGQPDSIYTIDEVKHARRSARAHSVKQVKQLRKTGSQHLQLLLYLTPPAAPAAPPPSPSTQQERELEQFLQRQSREEF